jgi:hypothetical protein
MPTIAIVDGVKIMMYANDHPPAHFHALFAEDRAVIDVGTLKLVRAICRALSVEPSSNGPRRAALNCCTLVI